MESCAAWTESSSQEKPTWEIDEYRFSISWAATTDDYLREPSCHEFSTCVECWKQGGAPYVLDEASVRDKIIRYTGVTEPRYGINGMVWFLGQDYTWHCGKVIDLEWSHATQVWVYSVVDLGKDYSGVKLTKREDDVYPSKPNWDPVVIDTEQTARIVPEDDNSEDSVRHGDTTEG